MPTAEERLLAALDRLEPEDDAESRLMRALDKLEPAPTSNGTQWATESGSMIRRPPIALSEIPGSEFAQTLPEKAFMQIGERQARNAQEPTIRPRNPALVDALFQPPPLSATSDTRSRLQKLTGAQGPSGRGRVPAVLEPAARAVGAMGARILETGSDLLRSADMPGSVPGNAARTIPRFDAKRFMDELEVQGVLGEANFWDRLGQKFGDVLGFLQPVNAIGGGLAAAGLSHGAANALALGAVSAATAQSQAASQGRQLTGGELADVTIESMLLAPAMGLAVGEAVKGILKGPVGEMLRPHAGNAAMGAVFEGIQAEPGDRLEAALAGAAAFMVGNAHQQMFPGSRGTPKEFKAAADAVELGFRTRQAPDPKAEAELAKRIDGLQRLAAKRQEKAVAATEGRKVLRPGEEALRVSEPPAARQTRLVDESGRPLPTREEVRTETVGRGPGTDVPSSTATARLEAARAAGQQAGQGPPVARRPPRETTRYSTREFKDDRALRTKHDVSAMERELAPPPVPKVQGPPTAAQRLAEARAARAADPTSFRGSEVKRPAPNPQSVPGEATGQKGAARPAGEPGASTAPPNQSVEAGKPKPTKPKTTKPKEAKAAPPSEREAVLLQEPAEPAPRLSDPKKQARRERRAQAMRDKTREAVKREESEGRARLKRLRETIRDERVQSALIGASVVGAAAASQSEDDRLRAAAAIGMPFLAAKKLRGLVSRAPRAERAVAREFAQAPKRPAPSATPEAARLATTGEPGPRRMREILDEILPEWVVQERGTIGPAQQPKRKVVFREPLKPVSDRVRAREKREGQTIEVKDFHEGANPRVGRQTAVSKIPVASTGHALSTGFGEGGAQLARGVERTNRNANRLSGDAVFEMKKVLRDAAKATGIKPEKFWTDSSVLENRVRQTFEAAVDGKPIPHAKKRDVQILADAQLQLRAGKKLNLEPAERKAADRLRDWYRQYYDDVKVRGTRALAFLPLPDYGGPVVLARDVFGPSRTSLLGVKVPHWQRAHDKAIRVQEQIYNDMREHYPQLSRNDFFTVMAGQRGNVRDPFMNYSLNQPTASKANYLDLHRMIQTKHGLDALTPGRFAETYIPSVERRIAMAEFWGKDMALARDIVDVMRADRQNVDAAMALFDIASHQAPKTDISAIRQLSQLMSVTSLGRAGYKQLSSWANTAKYPVAYREGIGAFNDAFKQFFAERTRGVPESMRQKLYQENLDLLMHEIGTSARNEFQHLGLDMGGLTGNLAGGALKYAYGVTPMDRIGRLQAAAWSKRTLDAMLTDIEIAVRSGERLPYYRNLAREIWSDPAVQKIALKPTHTAAEKHALIVDAAEWLVARSQGRTDPADLPALMAHPLGRELFKFQSFNLRMSAETIRQFNVLDKNSTIRNPAARLKLLAGSAAALGITSPALYAIDRAIRADDEHDPWYRMWAEIAAGASMLPTALSIHDMMTGKYQDTEETLLGPTITKAIDLPSSVYKDMASLGEEEATKKVLISMMPQPFWGQWVGLPTRADLRGTAPSDATSTRPPAPPRPPRPPKPPRP